MLNDKQERFCREYVIDLNATQAAKRAGYSEKTAGQQGEQHLKKLEIQNRIKKLQSGISERLEITADMVTRELWTLATYSIQDLVEDSGEVINIKNADRDILKPVTGFKVTKKIIHFEGGCEERITTDVKLADKISAIEKVGKHIGYFEKDNKQKQPVVNLGNLSDSDLEKLSEIKDKLD